MARVGVGARVRAVARARAGARARARVRVKVRAGVVARVAHLSERRHRGAEQPHLVRGRVRVNHWDLSDEMH